MRVLKRWLVGVQQSLSPRRFLAPATALAPWAARQLATRTLCAAPHGLPLANRTSEAASHPSFPWPLSLSLNPSLAWLLDLGAAFSPLPGGRPPARGHSHPRRLSSPLTLQLACDFKFLQGIEFYLLVARRSNTIRIHHSTFWLSHITCRVSIFGRALTPPDFVEIDRIFKALAISPDPERLRNSTATCDAGCSSVRLINACQPFISSSRLDPTVLTCDTRAMITPQSLLQDIWYTAECFQRFK